MADLELLIWRALGEAADVSALLQVLTPSLRGAGIEAVALWSIQPERLCSEVLAAMGPDTQTGTTRPCTDREMQEVIGWCHDGEPARAAMLPVASTLAASDGNDFLVPLAAPHRSRAEHGILALRGARVSADLAKLLRAPFTAALARTRQLERLLLENTAQAADRDALRSRLQHDDLAEVIGSDGGLRQVFQQIDQVARTDTPVLILGETGSGKEVVTRAIHMRSRRAQGPVVRVNCGAIPNELIDSELFGHERGSFTGAAATRRGWFERANGGTLFLDEIGELALPAQVRLLRILQDGMLRRVGAQEDLRVDVRVVAATHRNLSDMVATGGFREDLWYRINVFPIRLPPLRERPQDIPALASHFAQRATKRLGGLPRSIDPADVSLLLGYHWPGNVRELAAVIERAAILGGGRGLELEAALGATRRPSQSSPAAPVKPATLDGVMREHVELALRRSRGRVEGPFGAARALGVNPHTLRSRMRKLGIDWRRYREA